MFLVHFSGRKHLGPIKAFECDTANKPQGALWVSDETADQPWSKLCFAYDNRPDRLIYRHTIVLSASARNLSITNSEQFDEFEGAFGTGVCVDGRKLVRNIDWCEVAKRYDAVIISPYQPQKAGKPIDSFSEKRTWYDLWDVASGVILSPEAVELVYPAVLTNWVFNCQACQKPTCWPKGEGSYICKDCDDMSRAGIRRRFPQLFQTAGSTELCPDELANGVHGL